MNVELLSLCSRIGKRLRRIEDGGGTMHRRGP